LKYTKTRRIISFLSFLLFPVFYNYMSPVMMIEGAANNVFTAALLYWILYAISSIFLGRAMCGIFCPLGALQTIAGSYTEQKPRHFKRLSVAKYVIFAAWIGAFIWVAVSSGGFNQVNFLYNTEKILSVDSVAGLVRYYIIMSVPLIFIMFFGKMGFCKYFCPFSVLSIAGSKIGRTFNLPSLRLIYDKEKCINCKKCESVCAMDNTLPMRQNNKTLKNCRLCGECSAVCPNGAIRKSFLDNKKR
jgi:ferredoxin-type protein NapH